MNAPLINVPERCLERAGVATAQPTALKSESPLTAAAEVDFAGWRARAMKSAKGHIAAVVFRIGHWIKGGQCNS